ncbi:hypothetical protein [Streptomyces roseolilacinus]|uniref:Uncharacterized protein n=1 Tax=Streptomyces roseolilacinus TaxID=66904 RepID=A0A918AZN7_9ACTN|nr:hypothetical protein [Streptomyces roseolilacinus]GGQ06183.1 hypothetical protein GCM10010249_25990 [Streptomyces roseolilacinus]
MSSDQQYPYDPRAPRDPSPYAGRPYGEQPPAAPFPAGAGAADAEVAQTWQGQTWDTHYQPAVRPQQPQPPRMPDDTTYLPPQGPGGHPAPPQAASGHPTGYDAPTAYLPPVAGHDPAPSYGQAAAPSYGQAVPGHGQAPSYGHAVPGHGQAPSYGQVVPGHGHGSHAGQPEAPVATAPGPAPAPAPTTAPATPAPAGEPGYGAPTTLGNARITDAQRARAEGRSPIIDPGVQPAGLTALLGVLLAGGAALGTYVLLVPLVLLQAVTAAGWFRLNGMWPARQGIALAFLGGAVADAALLATGREHAPAALLGTLGVWVLLVLVLQLRSHAAAEERMYGLMATVVSSALAVVAAGFLAAEPDAVVVGALAVAAAAVVRALPLPGAVSLVAALAAGAGAGLAAGQPAGLGAQAAVLGLAAGVCAVIGLRVAAYDYPSRFVHMTAGVALPLTVAAPAVYLLGRALV